MTDNPWVGTIRWIRRQFSHAIGRGTPREGMRASAILFVITFASNFVGLFFTIVLDILLAFLFLFNLSRFLWRRWL